MKGQKDESKEKEENKAKENILPDDQGTGLYDLGVAIGGQGGGLVGNDNPGRIENPADKKEETQS
jgi:hypothetical protein